MRDRWMILVFVGLGLLGVLAGYFFAPDPRALEPVLDAPPSR